ncbi:hypothetical protein V5799_007497 [Amblyomma americanum]|uniref:Uncharacterized protein n=1 Tax=Amblyomma americanum TaxID=6943 RepID=A0AAQ4FG96_AMBAM
MADHTVSYREGRFEGLIPLFLSSEEPPRPAPNNTVRPRKLCLAVFIVMAIMTVACACAAIVTAAAEHFRSPSSYAFEESEQEHVGIPSNSARIAYQKLSEEARRKLVFCFLNTSLPSGSPYPFDVDNVSVSLCDALVYVAVGLDANMSAIRLKNPARGRGGPP